MAQGIMIICDENDNQKEVFSIYDEKYKVIYAMANYALRWYDNHQNERKKIFNKSRLYYNITKSQITLTLEN